MKVYGSNADTVTVGNTPGYFGAVATTGSGVVIVYGSGYRYKPWMGSYWFGPPVSYGFGCGMGWTPWGGWSHGFGVGWSFGWGTSVGWGWRPSPWWGPIGWGYYYRPPFGVFYRPPGWGWGGWGYSGWHGGFGIAWGGRPGYGGGIYGRYPP